MNDFKPAFADQTVACFLCNGTSFEPYIAGSDYEYGLPGNFHVSLCANCGLMLQNPRPMFADIFRYYTERYEPFREIGSAAVRRAREWALVKPRTKLYQRLIGKKGCILDVGCASGQLLRDLNKFGQWELMGVEPNKEAAQMAIDAGFQVHCSELLRAKIGPSSVDLIVMNHVIEHLPDPKETVEHIWKLLKPGGYFVGEIPSADCVERILFGPYWGGYHLPRHLTFFSKKHIIRFLEQSGFVDVKLRRDIHPSAWLLSGANYLRSKNFSGPLFKIISPHNSIGLAILTPMCLVLKFMGNAPILTFIARKAPSREL